MKMKIELLFQYKTNIKESKNKKVILQESIISNLHSLIWRGTISKHVGHKIHVISSLIANSLNQTVTLNAE